MNIRTVWKRLKRSPILIADPIKARIDRRVLIQSLNIFEKDIIIISRKK